MNIRTYSTEIADAIKSFLTEDGISFSFDEEKGVFEFTLETTRGMIKKLNYIINIRSDDFFVYAISPVGPDRMDKDMMARMTSFICLCNIGFDYGGNFDLNINNGEIRYKYHVDCNGVIPTQSMIENSIRCPLTMLQYYGDGILNIIFSNIDPRKAYLKSADNLMKALYSRLSARACGEGENEAEGLLTERAERSDERGKDTTEETEEEEEE